MLLYSFYAFLLIGSSNILLKLKIDCKMSPDNGKKSDMPDSCPTPIFGADSDEIGSVGISH